MNDQHKMELLKALREHGQTIKQMADGGLMHTMGTEHSQPAAPYNPGVGGPSAVGAGTPSTSTGALQGLNDFLGTQSNFQAAGANLQAGTNAGQLNQSYNQAQSGLGQQQNFLDALRAQNGVQNQSDVFNQMQGVANGTGPNPAQAMLNSRTGQNVANQAALMAGQRGASANVGQIARQAAQQGAQTQQNAIGQGAELQSQQSLNAMNNLAGISQNQVNQLGQATQGYNTAAQNEQNILQGANSAYNNASVGMQSNLNNVNAMISQGNQGAGNGLTGGIMQGLSSMGGMMGFKGGEVPHFDEGGEVGEADLGDTNFTAPEPVAAPQIGSAAAEDTGGSSLQKGFAGGGGGGGGGKGGGLGSMMGLLALASGGEAQPGGPKSKTAKFMKGFNAGPGPNIGSAAPSTGGQSLQQGAGDLMKSLGAAQNMKSGGNVPGKPKVGGAVNTEKNDNVPALLSAGEIVLPRSVTQSGDPVANAAKFVAAIMAKKGHMPGKKKAA